MNCVPLYLVAVTILLPTGTTAPPRNPAGAKTPVLYCPVAGLPEAKACCCPRTPNTYCHRFYCTYEPRPNLTVEYKGARLQLCCEECEKIFKATPEKFAAVAHHQLVATKQAEQTHCPLTRKAIDPTLFSDVAGVRVFFGSAESQKRVAEASVPERVNLVFGEAAFVRGFVITGPKK